MQRLDTKIKTFYNEQLKIDEEVLSFLKKREENMEASMLQKAKGSNISIRNNSKILESSWRREARI